tara:strand:- start:476 stop:637 length:162 start_codon:yes stop_codon:yes gene_type:complete
MSEDITQQITDYVYKHYKTYKGMDLIITEHANSFHILKHKDASPLILGKGIIK